MLRINYRKKFRKPVVLRAKVKRKLFNKIQKTIKLFLIFVIILTTGFFVGKTIRKFIYSETFKIKQIEVEGLKFIQKEKFLDALSNAGLKVGSSLIESYFVNIEKPICKYLTEVKSVKIKRYLPDRIKFIVTEREPIATVEVVSQLYDLDENVSEHKVSQLMAIDDENVIFVTDRDLTFLPRIIVYGCAGTKSFGTLTSTNFVRNISSVVATNEISCWTAAPVKLLSAIQKLHKELYLTILELYNIDGKLELVLRDNTKIFWGEYNTAFVDMQLKLLNKVLLDAANRFKAKNVEYIDLKLFNERKIILKLQENWRQTKWEDKKLYAVWI